MKSPASQRFSSLLIALGSAAVLSALLINPWTGEFYHSTVINYQDVLATYFSWAMIIGLLMVVNGLVLRWTTSDAINNMSLMFATCALIVLSDRLLLARFGLPLWIADLDSHYKHRPNAIRSSGGPMTSSIGSILTATMMMIFPSKKALANSEVSCLGIRSRWGME